MYFVAQAPLTNPKDIANTANALISDENVLETICPPILDLGLSPS